MPKVKMDEEMKAFAADVLESIAQAKRGEVARLHTPADNPPFVLSSAQRVSKEVARRAYRRQRQTLKTTSDMTNVPSKA